MRSLCLTFIAALAATTFLFTSSAPAGQPESAKRPFSAEDLKFIEHAWYINTTEITLGGIADKNAESADVKDFAKHMVKDHTKANEDLAALVRERNASLPSELDKHHQEIVDRLSKLSGAEFDKQYMTTMIAGHQKAIALFEKEANSDDKKANGDPSAASQLAADTLPHLKEHLQMAVKVGKGVGATLPDDGAAAAADRQGPSTPK